jgi:hypothetical protein
MFLSFSNLSFFLARRNEKQKCVQRSLRGTWSRDGLELSWHAWVNFGLDKGGGRFFLIPMLLLQNLSLKGQCPEIFPSDFFMNHLPSSP